jgi:hypothetical protein
VDEDRDHGTHERDRGKRADERREVPGVEERVDSQRDTDGGCCAGDGYAEA